MVPPSSVRLGLFPFLNPNTSIFGPLARSLDIVPVSTVPPPIHHPPQKGRTNEAEITRSGAIPVKPRKGESPDEALHRVRSNHPDKTVVLVQTYQVLDQVGGFLRLLSILSGGR
jgi:hypothetical protein